MEAAAVIVVVMAAGLAAAGAALTLASWLVGRGDGQEAWSAAVRRAGLAALEERPGEMAGWSGRLHVSLSRYRRSKDAAGTLITVSGPGLAGPALTFRPESFETGLLHRSGRHDVETGDADFDRSVWAEGDEARALAVLDAPTRAALRALVHGQLARPGRSSFWASGWFENGTLRVDLSEDEPPTPALGPFSESRGGEVLPALYLGGRPEHLPDAIDATLELARRLAPPEDVPRRLVELFAREPESAVRLRLFDVLTARFTSHPAASECARAALADADADVRARAAVVAGPEARPVLLAVAHGDGALDETSARAVAVLAGSLTVAETTEVLRNALRLRKLLTARACLRVLGARGGKDALDMLSRVLAVEHDEVAEWAADALGATGDAAAEPALLRTLGAPGSRRRSAAARALGQLGTLVALPDLRRAEAEDAGVRRAARQAIALIRSRATGVGPGQLSLAGDEAGRVSLAESDDHGQLSLSSRRGESA